MKPEGYMEKTQQNGGVAQAQIVGQASRLPSKPSTPQAGRLRYIL